VKPLAALAALFLLLPGAAAADRAPVEVSTDFDAEFARAADLLEEGRRSEAERILEAIRLRVGLPSWDARAALLLAADDARRRDFEAAAEALAAVNAAPIGLEAYRNLRRAEALELSSRSAEAVEPARLAFEAEGTFAFRIRAAALLARLLEHEGRPMEAARVLALAAPAAATPDESAEVAIARMRLAAAGGDTLVLRSAARDLVLQAPAHDALSSTPSFARRAAADAEKALSPPDRARRGRALVAAGDARRGVALLSRDRAEAWPEGERGANLLALARGQRALKQAKAAEATAARVADDGTLAGYEARLLRCDLIVGRLSGGRRDALDPSDLRLDAVKRALEELTTPGVSPSVRRGARERLLRFAADGEDFEAALALARETRAENPDSLDGFEALWRLAWMSYRSGQFPQARARFEALAALFDAVSISRRLAYWRARCLEEEGRHLEAEAILAELAAAEPPDLYAAFARARIDRPARVERPALTDPSTATAAFARVDELLRLRMFEEASAEARILLPSRGRELRIAQADFALGRFLTAAAAIKRALPEIGTAEEGRVPDGWRRLYYPIEEGGFLPERAREYSLDPSVLRGLVRQESVFDANAKSRAGAMGLMQLMPATAKSLSRSVLRARYRRAFLYDPGVNARLGAAYLKDLLARFDDSTVFALAAYNGGPTRIARLLRENPGLPEDELFESIPLFETRDYVRRVLLYAEAYRELYP
jgi:soluble lytic murein transglycosylase-like protein